MLAENGFLGAAIWIGLFGYSFVVLLPSPTPRQSRRRRAAMTVFPDRCVERLMVSLVAFLVGGAFIALSLNDLTWYTFAFVAALDRLSRHSFRVRRPRL